MAQAEDYPGARHRGQGRGLRRSAFPDTAYSLPVIYSLLGRQGGPAVGHASRCSEECRALLPPVPADKVWLPYLGDTLDAGMATLFAFEIIEACKYLIGPNPVNGIWLGAADDVIIRERGIEFVDGSAPGFAAVVGAAPTNEDAVRIARELQEKNLYVFMAGHTNGVSFAEQLAEAGVQTGLGDPAGAVRQGHLRGHLRAGLRQPRGAELRRRASRATTRATCATTRTASSPS